MRFLELLSPARDLECGMAAITHGADAVYIGAEAFGARAAAKNSTDDIARLCRFAHRFGARVYVAVNTIIYDDELPAAERLLRELEKAGADAILVQDMALVELMRGGAMTMEMHASTQTDNRSAEKVMWLRDQGFSRVVLARELSLDEIADISRQAEGVELEVFVHGALCVSHSGLCYASQHCFARSANRGECAQFCRLKFTLADADGRIIERDKHLLSLRDLNLHSHLEALAEAGATSFKIEGRLKDAAYVKNVVAAYSQKLNDIVALHPDKYRRASLGTCRYAFTPNLEKTFHRPYTTYFLNGRQPNMSSPDTPKAMGESVGRVVGVGPNHITTDGQTAFANGDGLCFLNEQRQLEGFRVNRAEGQRLFPASMPRGIRPGMRLFRNHDQEFERTLARPQSAERRIMVKMKVELLPGAMALTATAPDGFEARAEAPVAHEEAKTPQADNVRRQLLRLGTTVYECDSVELPEGFSVFVPASVLADLRRRVVEQLDKHDFRRPRAVGKSISPCPPAGPSPGQDLPWRNNIANRRAAEFYAARGLKDAPPAFELRPAPGARLMQCRFCLRSELGFCERSGGQKPQWREPLTLSLPDGRRFRLEFNCRECAMNVYSLT